MPWELWLSSAEVLLLIGVAVWLAVLTLGLLLVVRQIALLTIRLDENMSHIAPNDDGLDVGHDIPDAAAAALPEAASGVAYVILISSSCGTCRELVADLPATLPAPAVVLLTGHGKVADALDELIPATFRVVRDPDAADLAGQLKITTTPFALEIETRTVTAKSYLHAASDLEALVRNRASSDAAEYAQRAREVRGDERVFS